MHNIQSKTFGLNAFRAPAQFSIRYDHPKTANNTPKDSDKSVYALVASSKR